jgi:YD repeat-containing protein
MRVLALTIFLVACESASSDSPADTLMGDSIESEDVADTTASGDGTGGDDASVSTDADGGPEVTPASPCTVEAPYRFAKALETRDDGDDGTNEMRYERSFDDEARLVQTLVDQSADGSWDFASRRTFPTPGEKDVIETEHRPVDAEASYRSFTDFDATGNPVFRGQDYQNDGVYDASSRTTHAIEDGRVVKSEVDVSDDGSIDEIQVFTYDDQGRLLTTSIDYGADGLVDFKSARTWAADGRSVVTASDMENDGVIDTTETETYDEAGHLIASVSEGAAEARTEWSYDANGFLVAMRSDADGDGTWDYTSDYTNDDWGRPTLLVSADVGLDTTSRTTWVYTCEE